MAPLSPTPTTVATQTPHVDALDTPEAKARITKGEQIYKRIASRTGLPVMFGWRASKMSLLIPISDWNKMPKEDQINLTFYAENLVREIRMDPAPYARRWSNYYKRTEQVESGMEYDGFDESSYIEQVGNLCYTCWDITVGLRKRDGFYDEAVPVKGDTVREFRQSAQKETEKTAADEEVDDFRQFAASMPPDEHLEQARQALDSGYDPANERFGNTVLARKHIMAIPRGAPEYGKAQKLLRAVVHRERERKEFQDAVIREVKRLADAN